MRKCCCCVGVHVGAVILGILGVLLAALELAVLIPYLLGVDEETFNPIKQNTDHIFYIMEKMMKEANNATSEVLSSLDVDSSQVGINI